MNAVEVQIFEKWEESRGIYDGCCSASKCAFSPTLHADVVPRSTSTRLDARASCSQLFSAIKLLRLPLFGSLLGDHSSSWLSESKHEG